MNQYIRTTLTPIAIILIVFGFLTNKLLILGSIGGIILLYMFFFYSGRKQRISYWVQTYLSALEDNAFDEKKALNEVYKEFCQSKYADEEVKNSSYDDLDSLLLAITVREFRFHVFLQPPNYTKELQKNIHDYMKAKEKVKKEIVEVKREVLGN